MSVDDFTWIDDLLTEQLEVSGLESALWALVAVTLVGDLVTTFVGLHVGLAESNPVARGAIDAAGVIGMVILKALAIAVAVGLRGVMPPEYRALVPAALAVPWLLASLFNVYAITTTV